MKNVDSVNTYRSTIQRLRHEPILEKATFLKKLTDDTDTVLKKHIDNVWPTGNKIILSWIMTTIFIPIAIFYLIGLGEDNLKGGDSGFRSLLAGLSTIPLAGFHAIALSVSYDNNKEKPYNRDKLDKQFIERPDELLSGLLTFFQNIHGINPDIESKKEISLKIFDANEESKIVTDAYLDIQSSIDKNKTKMTDLEQEIKGRILKLKQKIAPPPYQKTKTSAAETASAAEQKTLALMEQHAESLHEIFEEYNSKDALETYLKNNREGLTKIQVDIINLQIELLALQEIQPELAEKLTEKENAFNQLFDKITTANDEVLVSSIGHQGNRYGTFPTLASRENGNKEESQPLLAPQAVS